MRGLQLKKHRTQEERLLEELMRLRKQLDVYDANGKFTTRLRNRLKLNRIKKRVIEIDKELQWMKLRSDKEPHKK